MLNRVNRRINAINPAALLITNCVNTADTDKTRQFCLVHVSGVNKLLLARSAGQAHCRLKPI